MQTPTSRLFRRVKARLHSFSQLTIGRVAPSNPPCNALPLFTLKAAAIGPCPGQGGSLPPFLASRFLKSLSVISESETSPDTVLTERRPSTHACAVYRGQCKTEKLGPLAESGASGRNGRHEPDECG